jgi:GTP-binding protein HflX
LTESAGANVVAVIQAVRNKPHPATFIGEGKIAEIKDCIEDKKANVVIVNHPITPIQERNLERALDCRVLDRTRLILDIFAQRAQSHEGKLQVELAQLKHLSTRLVRGWTHLERQKGGIGLRGPGETQLETDRRLISKRIKSLSRRLENVEKQRKLRRRARDRIPVPVITLVGYTNAGKSTLFNCLVDESVYAADKLFATLDPTMRRLNIDNYGKIILSDTVGFIQDLPHSLVTAFHSTLEEVEKSSILLHVIDRSNPDYRNQIAEVGLVLREIGAEDIPTIKVFNKIDMIKNSTELKKDSEGNLSVFLSAQKNLGLDCLSDAIFRILTANHEEYYVKLEPEQEKLRSQIHSRCQVIKESFDETGHTNLQLYLSPKTLGWLRKHCLVEKAVSNKTH